MMAELEQRPYVIDGYYECDVFCQREANSFADAINEMSHQAQMIPRSPAFKTFDRGRSLITCVMVDP